jgi:hypothetical protein
MKRSYKVMAVREAPSNPQDLGLPKCFYVLTRTDGAAPVETRLPRRGDWRIGDTVDIDENLVMENLTQGVKPS